MPRAGSVYTLPANYLAVSGETIEATQHNDPLEDIAEDLNAARPIGNGGTGQVTAIAAIDALHTKGANVASATTTDIGAASGRFVHITGTTTITGFGTKTAGVVRILTFDGILTLTHDDTSLILPTGANITTAAGDNAVMVSEGSGNWRCIAFVRKDGTALAQPAALTGTSAVITSTNDGATGALIVTQHISASPAALDGILGILAQGKDSAGNTETYATQTAVIFDPTSTSEDGYWTWDTVIAGTLANRMSLGAGLIVGTPSGGGDPGTGKINAVEVQENGVALKPLTSGTAQATTSGTSKDFTSIPSWVKRISVQFSAFSTNGTSIPMIQLGDSGGIETSGYSGTGQNISGTSSSNSAGFKIAGVWAGTAVLDGIAYLELQDASTNTWAMSSSMSGAEMVFGGGSKSLSATLDRIRITMVNGTDAFDAGKVNILYE